MFRVNIQVCSESAITAGDGTPGGTNGVLFVDKDSKKLKLVMPDGTVLIGKTQEDDTLKFVVQP